MSNSNSLLLPVNINDFYEIRKNNFYYVDKTRLVEQLFDHKAYVTLITRPKRFGNTLNMSMLKYFLEIGTNPSLFDGLYISSNKELCEKHLGQYPVISLSFKDVLGKTFEIAQEQIIHSICTEANRFSFLKDDPQYFYEEKDSKYMMNDCLLNSSLYNLSSLLHQYYGKRVVILIDEYNVPLLTAHKNGYYREMKMLINCLLGSALKSNDHLNFAVLTGCQSVIKGDEISGLNNIKTLSITSNVFDDQFGFTEEEVTTILKDYHLENKFNEVQEWYGGYRFGSKDNLFCSQDVIQYVDLLLKDSNTKPQSFWFDACDNTCVKQLVSSKYPTFQTEAERLVNGESLYKPINEYLTYEEMDKAYNFDNKWSTLLANGYVTHLGSNDYGDYQLIIPNKEIKVLFENEMEEWFEKYIFSNTEKFQELYHSFEIADTQKIETNLNIVLNRSMSVFDAEGNDIEKENAYHNFLSGILTGNDDWSAQSNLESGEGRADIIIEKQDLTLGIVIELKYVKEKVNMEEACDKALEQIKEKRYIQYLLNKDITNILIYGITFCKKRCKVIAEKI